MIRPKQMANDIWRGSERGAEVSQGWRLVPVPSLLHWWWGLFLVEGLLTYFGQRSVNSGYDKLVSFGIYSNGFDQIKTGTTADVLGAIVGIFASILAILVVARITERLNEIRDEALAQAPPVSQYAAAAQYPPYSQTPPAPATTQFAQPPAPLYTPPTQTHYQAPAQPQQQYPQSQPPPPPPPAAPAPPATGQLVQCPDCAEWIQAEANVCRFCGHRLRPLGQ